MNDLLPELSTALQPKSMPPAVQNELRFLFSCIHKDMPESISVQLAAGTGAGWRDERSLGFALGDLSQPWQQDLLRWLLSRINNPQTLRVFARAIWRSEGSSVLSELPTWPR